jgi:cellulose biosynthesis protein BcsQ
MGMIPNGEQKRGVIYTFYSYKGGVGRSMAVANVGALLAKWGKRVLIIDWDLEAPGIEKFFEKWLTGTRREKPGLLELISAFDQGEPIDWRECLLRANLSPGADLAIISAGRDDSDYTSRLQQIDWEQLFAKQKFGSYLETLRNDWLHEYDFILIDSRTGVTDIGGICTIHLPDIVVTFFTASGQSLAGVKDVMVRARRAHADLPVDRKRLVIVPIPARDESSNEYKLAKEWRERFARELDVFFREWAPESEKSEDILDRLKIPYFAYWSFGERLPVMEEDPENPKTLAFSYQLVGRLLLGRLNWEEVKHGTVSTEAAAEQKVKAGKLVLEATQVRVGAQREFAEREMARLEQQRQHFLEGRWQPMVKWYQGDALWAGRRFRLTEIILTTAFAVAIFGLLLSMGYLGINLTNAKIIGRILLGVGIGCLILGFQHFRRFLRRKHASRSVADALIRERSLFEGLAGPYRAQTLENALRQFIETTEVILQGETHSAEIATTPAAPAPLVSSVSTPEILSAVPQETPPSGQVSLQTSSQRMDVAPALELAGPYDIFVSYRRNSISTAWLQEFLPLLSGFLDSLLPDPTRIFVNTAIASPGEDWSKVTEEALQSARCLLAVISPAYVRSDVCMGELNSFLKHQPNGIVIPMMVEKTDLNLPEQLRSRQWLDFSEFFYVGTGLTQSSLYVDFQKRVRHLAQDLAERLLNQAVL